MTQTTEFTPGQATQFTSGDGSFNGPTHQSLWPFAIAAKCQFSVQAEIAGQLLARGELAESARQFRELLQIGLTEHDHELSEVACHNLAAVFRQSCHWDVAKTWQQQSISWRMRHAEKASQQSVDELGRLACDLTGRGADAFLQQEWELAGAFWRRALAIEEWRGSFEGQAADSGNLGLLAAAQGQLVDGIRWLKQSLRLHRLMLDACGEGTDLMNLAELQRRRGEFVFAIRLLRKAIDCFDRAEAEPLRDLAKLRLRELQRILSLATLDPQIN